MICLNVNLYKAEKREDKRGRSSEVSGTGKYKYGELVVRYQFFGSTWKEARRKLEVKQKTDIYLQQALKGEKYLARCFWTEQGQMKDCSK